MSSKKNREKRGINKSKHNKKRRINKKKLAIVIVASIVILFAGFKLTQGAFGVIANIQKSIVVNNNKDKTKDVTTEQKSLEQFDLESEVANNQNKKHTIFIDPGHGGNDVGTKVPNTEIFEKDINLQIAKKVATILSKQSDVYSIISRTEDKYLSLSQRADMANSQKSDVMVSIHLNALPGDNKADGIETYYTEGETNGSKELAQSIQSTMTSYVQSRDRGVKTERFQILLECDMPAVLIEAGFITNPNEAKNLQDEKYQDQLAEGIAQGILAFLDKNSDKQ